MQLSDVAMNLEMALGIEFEVKEHDILRYYGETVGIDIFKEGHGHTVAVYDRELLQMIIDEKHHSIFSTIRVIYEAINVARSMKMERYIDATMRVGGGF